MSEERMLSGILKTEVPWMNGPDEITDESTNEEIDYAPGPDCLPTEDDFADYADAYFGVNK